MKEFNEGFSLVLLFFDYRNTLYPCLIGVGIALVFSSLFGYSILWSKKNFFQEKTSSQIMEKTIVRPLASSQLEMALESRSLAITSIPSTPSSLNERSLHSAFAPVRSKQILYSSSLPIVMAQRALVDIIGSQHIVRAHLALDVENYEPVHILSNSVRIDPNGPTRLYWFNDIKELMGKKVYHRWYYEGLLMSQIEIKVKAQRYRASSYKTLQPQHQGRWWVETLDENLVQLTKFEFDITLGR